jgi:hypothetical protein
MACPNSIGKGGDNRGMATGCSGLFGMVGLMLGLPRIGDLELSHISSLSRERSSILAPPSQQITRKKGGS